MAEDDKFSKPKNDGSLISQVPKDHDSSLSEKHVRLCEKQTRSANNILLAMDHALTPSFNIFWILNFFSTVELSAAGFSVLPIALSGIGFLFLGIFCYRVYTKHQELKSERNKLYEEFNELDHQFAENNKEINRKLTSLKEKLESLSKRSNLDIKTQDEIRKIEILLEGDKTDTSSDNAHPDTPHPKKLKRIKTAKDFLAYYNKDSDPIVAIPKDNSIEVGINAGIYVIAINGLGFALLYTFSVVALASLFTPLGIVFMAATLLLAVGLGIGLGFKHYEEEIMTKEIDLEKQKMNSLLSEQRDTIVSLKKNLYKLKIRDSYYEMSDHVLTQANTNSRPLTNRGMRIFDPAKLPAMEENTSSLANNPTGRDKAPTSVRPRAASQ